jgi:spore coat protein A, manganese oxidase
MAISRREFLQGAAIAGASLVLPFKWNARRAYAFSQSPTIPKFSTGIALPGLGSTGIPLATATAMNVGPVTVDAYNLGVAEFTQQIPGVPGSNTHFWGYYDKNVAANHRYLGGVIVATRGKPVLLKVTNELPNHQIIPIDLSIMAGPNLTVGQLPLNRMAVHLHGGLTPWISDGTPFQWITPGGIGYQAGPSLVNVPGIPASQGTATYYYPMAQSARMVWYHDHAIGITRTNAYSGIASALIITDDFETYLNQQTLIPNIGAPYLYLGIPLIIQDKTFLDKSKDPSYPVSGATDGDLWYPWDYEKDSVPSGRWAYGPDQTPPQTGIITPLPPIAEVPEFFADTALINGAPYPTLNVTEGAFRFRLLNGSQARVWHLNLYEEGSTPGECTAIPTPDAKPDQSTAVAGPSMYQIGTEGGFLPAVAVHPNGIPCPLDPSDATGNTANPDGPFNLLLAGAERADILIDFTGKVGKSYILYNDAPAPFPGGDVRNDYYTGDPDFTDVSKNSYSLSGGAPTTRKDQGPNTRTIMKFVVGPGSTGLQLTAGWLATMNAALKKNFTGGNPAAPQQDPLLYHALGDVSAPGPVPLNPGLLPPGVVVRNLTLNEDFDEFGRLIQREGTTDNAGLTTMDGLTVNGLNNQGLPTWGRGYLDDPTETPNVGAIEVWNIYNLTMDTHPIHFHLVNVQLIQRAQFGFDLNGMPVFTPISGTERGPDQNEKGWKETVRMNGVSAVTNRGEVATVIMKFGLPQVPFTMPFSARDAFPPNANEYVWHCHILEHEEHDMMRPLVVVGPNPLAVFPAAQDAAKKSTATFNIYNGTPPYTITVADKQDAKKFPPVPATVGASGGSFTVDLKKGTAPNADVTYTVKDSAGVSVAAVLTITKK